MNREQHEREITQCATYAVKRISNAMDNDNDNVYIALMDVYIRLRQLHKRHERMYKT